ncbi:MAG: NAD(P)/FAD-dependent oxidoreductase [Bacteroidia bacterium]
MAKGLSFIVYLRMDLRSPTPFWLMSEGSLRDYPSLDKTVSCEVAVIGGGITGALISYHLSQAGIGHLVVDKAHIGMGSTCASTGLLQYEIDTPLRELVKKVPEKNAVRSYKLCSYAIDALKAVSETIHYKDFGSKSSLQYASFKTHVKDLKAEFKLRQGHRIADMEWLDETDVKARYGFSKPAAILSHKGAMLDPYKFTHQLLKHSVKAGNQVYANTEIKDVVQLKKGMRLVTASGQRINCRYLVVACGYESQRYIEKRVEQSNSTFAIISEPLKTKGAIWHHNSLIWETARPYLYLRTTSDNRIIVGGKDVALRDGKKRDRLIPSKSAALEHDFRKLFPDIPFKTDFAWSGFFGETKDGLPYIGKIKGMPHTFFALGFGGNGITFSLLAAEMIRDALKGTENKDTKIFSFER